MKTSDFDYDLPSELIAQTPTEPRDSSRLLIASTTTQTHAQVKDLTSLLLPGDCLVLNNTQVIPGRLFATNENSHNKIEIFLINEHAPMEWNVLARPARKLKTGTQLTFSADCCAEVISILDDGQRRLKFTCTKPFSEIIEQIGHPPLPPYIKIDSHTADQLKQRYQTVFASTPGAVAAPTAGLHFTQELLNKLREKGVRIAFVTLHVGIGTFRPVEVENIADHKMHAESYSLPQETIDMITETQLHGHRIIAVGTTVVRVLESIYQKYGKLQPDKGETSIFITPGFSFHIIDGLMTNFHLPCSTLLMLCSAFMGKERMLSLYQTAIHERYRFFSFGDAMLLWKK